MNRRRRHTIAVRRDRLFETTPATVLPPPPHDVDAPLGRQTSAHCSKRQRPSSRLRFEITIYRFASTNCNFATAHMHGPVCAHTTCARRKLNRSKEAEV